MIMSRYIRRLASRPADRQVNMNCLLVAGLLITTLSLAQAGLDRDQSIALLKKCQEKTKASEDPVEVFDTQKIPDSEKGKCMMACVLKEKGLMKNGKMDGTKITEFFDKKYQDDPEKLSLIADAIAHCTIEIDTKGDDECVTAYKYLTCGQKKGVKL